MPWLRCPGRRVLLGPETRGHWPVGRESAITPRNVPATAQPWPLLSPHRVPRGLPPPPASWGLAQQRDRGRLPDTGSVGQVPALERGCVGSAAPGVALARSRQCTLSWNTPHDREATAHMTKRSHVPCRRLLPVAEFSPTLTPRSRSSHHVRPPSSIPVPGPTPTIFLQTARITPSLPPHRGSPDASSPGPADTALPVPHCPIRSLGLSLLSSWKCAQPAGHTLSKSCLQTWSKVYSRASKGLLASGDMRQMPVLFLLRILPSQKVPPRHVLLQVLPRSSQNWESPELDPLHPPLLRGHGPPVSPEQGAS